MEKTGRIEQLEAAIRLSRLPGVGAATFLKLIKEYRLPVNALRQYLFAGQHKEDVKSATSREIGLTMAMLREEKIFAHYCCEAGYPRQLLDLSEPPPLLFSSSPELSGRFAAVVGSRKPDQEALAAVAPLVESLGRKGFQILSGGAVGIDAAAHRAAIKLKIPTYAVFGCGLDTFYPTVNAQLFKQICGSGGLISELLCGAKPQKGFFPTRNRIIAALADVVVVIQARKKSGSLITASWAEKLQRELFVKMPDEEPKFGWEGSIDLIAKGKARPLRQKFSL